MQFRQLDYHAGDRIDTAELECLCQIVSAAANDGIYSNFKLTIYHTPDFDCTYFWQRSQNRDELLAMWQIVWSTFRGNPSVVGYELLNEPSEGKLNLSHADFNATYLVPLYQRTIIALRCIDAARITFFQPEVELGQNSGKIALSTPLTAANIAYSPHFYPPHPGFSTTRYIPDLQIRLSEAASMKVPLIFGEYGSRWDLTNDGNTALEGRYQTLESYSYSLFNKYGLSYSRDWYADDLDAGKDPANGPKSSWSIIRGVDLNGPFRTWITQPFSAAVNG